MRWDRRRRAARAGLGSVHEQLDVAALAEPAAVVGEFHPHLMLAGRHRVGAVDRELLNSESVVAIGRTRLLRERSSDMG